MSGHTPGPWKASRTLPKRSNFERQHRVQISRESEPLKTVGYAYGETRDEALANGQLFAVAPELAEVLESLWRDIDTQLHGGRAEGYLQHVRDAREALRKAGRLP